MKNIFSKFNEFISDFFGPAPFEIPLGKSEYDKFWDTVYVSYEEALSNNKIVDFYLGRDKYFHRDSDTGFHNTSTSFFGLEAYSKKYGNEKMLILFKSDIENILNHNLTTDEFSSTINYIWIYLVNYYEDEKTCFNIEWRVEKTIRVLIKNQIEKFHKMYPVDSKYKELSDGYNFDQTLKSINIIKNRTGIDLLDESGNNDIDYQRLLKTKFDKELKENRYLEARQKNEVKKYLFGEGNYKLTSQDSENHNIYMTYMQLKFFGKTYGYELLFNNIENDLLSLVKEDIAIDEFHIVTNYIYYILNFKREIKYELDLNEELIKLTKEKNKYFQERYKDYSTIKNTKKLADNYGNYLEKINSLDERINSNFKIDLK